MPKSPSKSVSKLLPTPPVIKVPSSNIVIPTIWSASTQACLAEKRATPDVRREIVYTLSVMMRAGGPEATTRIECEKVANAIVARYPFLADPYGKSRSVSYYY